jgi:ParB/RepB/Spo0J family partition protein
MGSATGPYQLLPPLSSGELDDLRASIKEKGVLVPIIFDQDGNVIDGHHRLMICNELGISDFPSVVRSYDSEENRRSDARMLNIARRHLNQDQKRFVIIGELTDHPEDSNNSIAKRLGVSDTTVGKIRKTLELDNVDRVGADGKVYSAKRKSGSAITKFGVPPFSILDSSSGRWLERKKWWRDWGIESEVARDASAFSYGKGTDPISVQMAHVNNDISLFDPVLTELMVKWFSPDGGLVYDPFAGGPVRGVVSAALGRHYIGCELRDVQVEANRANAVALERLKMFEPEFHPKWICDDSSKVTVPKDIDMILTCPPYFDLEVYSDDDADLSNMSFDDFSKLYFDIFQRSVANMVDDSFVVVVIGNSRDWRGNLRDLTGLTVRALEKAGCNYYTDFVLKTPVGSSAVRLPQFEQGRKSIRLHQSVIVAVKGSGMKAAKRCPLEEVGFEV